MTWHKEINYDVVISNSLPYFQTRSIYSSQRLQKELGVEDPGERPFLCSLLDQGIRSLPTIQGDNESKVAEFSSAEKSLPQLSSSIYTESPSVFSVSVSGSKVLPPPIVGIKPVLNDLKPLSSIKLHNDGLNSFTALSKKESSAEQLSDSCSDRDDHSPRQYDARDHGTYGSDERVDVQFENDAARSSPGFATTKTFSNETNPSRSTAISVEPKLMNNSTENNFIRGDGGTYQEEAGNNSTKATVSRLSSVWAIDIDIQW